MSLKKYNWFAYLIYALVLLCCFIGSNWILASQSKMITVTFMARSTVVFIILGILLGLENLWLEARKEGLWRINVPKVILLGVPLLYFSMGFFISYSTSSFLHMMSYPIIIILDSKMAQTYLAIFQAMFGYVMMTSLYKAKDS